jgi:hypothetical protein
MTQQERIRAVFLHPAESYGLCEVARLTETPARKLRREAAAGDRDAAKVRGTWRFTWRQTVCLALECWTLAEIHEALGADAEGVLPPLLTLRTVTIQLPEYIIRALETVAADQGTTLDQFLYGELIDFAGSHSDRMEAMIPGYRHAYLFPGRG